MELGFLLYVFVSIVLILGGTFRYIRSGSNITAGIYCIGLLAIVIFFGLKWYVNGKSVTTPKAGPWPPTLNSCPDFLSVYKVQGKHYCIDPIGIAGTGGISQWTDPTQTDAKFLFNLNLDRDGSSRVSALCEECKTKKVTWEGIWDGASCLNGAEPPRPTS